MTNVGPLIGALDGGFSAHSLREMHELCVSLHTTLHPAAVLLVECISSLLAEKLEEGPVPTAEFEDIRNRFDPVLRDLLDAMAGDAEQTIVDAMNALAAEILAWRTED